MNNKIKLGSLNHYSSTSDLTMVPRKGKSTKLINGVNKYFYHYESHEAPINDGVLVLILQTFFASLMLLENKCLSLASFSV